MPVYRNDVSECEPQPQSGTSCSSQWPPLWGKLHFLTRMPNHWKLLVDFFSVPFRPAHLVLHAIQMQNSFFCLNVRLPMERIGQQFFFSEVFPVQNWRRMYIQRKNSRFQSALPASRRVASRMWRSCERHQRLLKQERRILLSQLRCDLS